MKATESEARRLAAKQLDAYNRGDINDFAACYADDVKLIRLRTGEVFVDGIDALREAYGRLFEQCPNLHVELTSRVICGPIAIDEERVTGMEAGKVVHAVATYEVLDGRIQRAWFVKGE